MLMQVFVVFLWGVGPPLLVYAYVHMRRKSPWGVGPPIVRLCVHVSCLMLMLKYYTFNFLIIPLTHAFFIKHKQSNISFLDNLHNLNLQLILTLKSHIIFILQNIIIISIYSNHPKKIIINIQLVQVCKTIYILQFIIYENNNS